MEQLQGYLDIHSPEARCNIHPNLDQQAWVTCISIVYRQGDMVTRPSSSVIRYEAW